MKKIVKEFWFGSAYTIKIKLYFENDSVEKKFIPLLDNFEYVLVEIFPDIPMSIKIGHHDKINLNALEILFEMEKNGIRTINFTRFCNTKKVRINIEMLTKEDFACSGNNPLAKPGWYRITIRYEE
ncbi:MAG: hypothetical protein WC755_08735 [Candidatus Woesearchaeota archaeon]|jgi:hypothetical protein